MKSEKKNGKWSEMMYDLEKIVQSSIDEAKERMEIANSVSEIEDEKARNNNKDGHS